jgi:hypothetical protein
LRNQKTATGVEKFYQLPIERLSCLITSNTPVESLRIQLLTQGTSAFLSFDTKKVIDCRKNRIVERTQPLRNFTKRSRAGYTNKYRFNWICMKLPNSTKKWKMRATLFTTKIMSLIKRKMKYQDFRLGKVKDHNMSSSYKKCSWYCRQKVASQSKMRVRIHNNVRLNAETLFGSKHL